MRRKLPSSLLASIKNKAARIGRPVTLMELCGTHTQAVTRAGLRALLPKNVRLISGPGCPVCVTDQSDIDAAVKLALAGIPIAAYGDVIAVPGTKMSLEQARQRGARVHAVYSIEEALQLAKTYNLKTITLCFFAIGFETTAPMTAWAVKQGLTVYSAHKLFPPAMAALLANPRLKIDGFICPGHVSAIIGTKPYEQFKVPQVVAGFEPKEVLLAIDELLAQIVSGKPKVENVYERLVRPEGNLAALRLMASVFTTVDARWRGLGVIPKSGLELRAKYRDQDAKVKFKRIISSAKGGSLPAGRHGASGGKTSLCKCDLVLQGLIEPKQCSLFGKKCTPENPQGACMVSVEGACNVAFKY